MAISSKLMRELVDILNTYLTDSQDCITHLIKLLGTEEKISKEVYWDKKSNYITALILQLDISGNLPSGEIALCGFLKLISEDVGEDVQEQINKLAQKIVEEQAIFKLKNILVPLEKQFFKEIQQSYSACLSNNFSDWEPENIEDIFTQFKDIYEKEASLQSIAKFVAKLLSIQKLLPNINHQLEQWRVKYTANFDHIYQQPRQDIKHKQDNIQRHLIILIEPSIQEPDKNLYIVKSWVIEEENLRYKSKSLDITYQKKEKFSFEEMPSLLSYFIQQSIDPMGNLLETIEIFLPRELFDKPIDTFIQKKIDDDDDDDELYGIGMKYNVSIRSYQRIKKLLKKKCRDEKIIRWQNKWQTLHKQREDICCSYLIPENNEDCLGQLLSSNVLGVKSFNTPSEDILKAIDQAGIPVALWLRSKLEDSGFVSEFESILKKCSIMKIPEKITEIRRKAFRKEKHIGQNIVLLWDNPNILPPEILPASLP
ncbi:hypothetical protein OGM63_20290 [Plectonema radiosum NIES-515]|uniref:Uncharacterized protein n=1 Tax=Plectonema radiosum NIES-515 TaxID=2986073 RepID=A0ABT3B364_9CYAN|nr:hypothetical protein [Plectonema radiosum]MCV3215817.1 hypothetical protein [Plectonema radiosum NIES-515]